MEGGVHSKYKSNETVVDSVLIGFLVLTVLDHKELHTSLFHEFILVLCCSLVATG